ncbi:MAG: hypothetical protein WCL51_05645 [Bacteroidota bacterium]
MGLFNFFKSKKADVNNVKEIIENASSSANENSIGKLSQVIFQSSMKLTDKSYNLWKIKGTNKNEEQTIRFSMLAEIIYFYLGFTDRIAFAVLSKQKRNELMNELVSILQFSVVETIFNGWDEKLKDDLKKYFSEGYIESQVRYSKGKELIDKNEPFNGNGLLSILGRQIAEINESSMNPEIIMKTIELTSASFNEMQLNKHIENFR